MKKLKFFVTLTLAAIAGCSYFFSTQLRAPSEVSGKIIFEVHPGSFKKTAIQLEKEGIIKNAFIFTLYARLKNKHKGLRIGEYELDKDMNASEVLSLITSGKSIEYPVTFQEGLNIFEYAKILSDKKLVDEKKFLSLCKNPQFIKNMLGFEALSLEGYLFPETYKFSKFTNEEEILKSMVNNFKSTVKIIDPDLFQDKKRLQFIITLASIVEKETGANFEREKVASVFYNRLKKKMRLQSDPTIIYGQKFDLGVDLLNIKKEDINKPTRFNTYVVDGLPNGPISNPGKATIHATLRPAETDYLYFVSYNNGTHYFSKTYNEHIKAVHKYQLDKKAREGKSWRDLSKSKTSAKTVNKQDSESENKPAKMHKKNLNKRK